MKSTKINRSKKIVPKRKSLFIQHNVQTIQKLLFNISRLIYKNKLLSAITLLGLLLRLLGTNPGYPQIHSDEPSIQEATRILVMYHKYDPQNYYYGSLLSIIYAIFIAFIGIPIFFIQVIIKDSNTLSILGLFGFLDYFYQKVEHGGYYFDTFYNFFPYWTRYATAILSSTATILVFLLTTLLFRNKKAGYVAAFFTAVNYRHVASSTLALADAPAAVFILLSLLLSVRLLTKAGTKTYLWAGVGIGLALSVKYFIYIIPAFIICTSIGRWVINASFFTNCKRLVINKNLYLAALVAIAVFVTINPYLFINREEVDSQMFINAKRYGLDLPTVLSKINPPFDSLVSPRVMYPYWYLFRYGYGQTLSIAIILGILYSILKYRKQSLVILSVLVPYFFLFSAISGNAPVRNYAPVTPLLLIFPAVLIIGLTKKIKGGTVRQVILIFLIIGIGFSSLKNSFLSSYYSSQPLNYTNYFTWINQHVPDGLTIARTSASFIQKNHTGIPLLLYDGGIGLSLQELRENKASYVILTTTDTTLSNMTTLSKFNKEIANAFFDESQLWNIMNETYLSLVLRELNLYTPVFFVKPYWQSLEPAIMLVRVPKNQNSEEKMLFSKSFEEKMTQKHSAYSPVVGNKTIDLAHKVGTNYSQGLFIPYDLCSDLQSIRLFSFPVTAGYSYKVAGQVKRTVDAESASYSNGFLRLNFYKKDKKPLTTHVTKLSQKDNTWEVLTASGVAPENSAYASVEFQTDTCYKNEDFTLDDIAVYKSLEKIPSEKIAKKNTELPLNFIWLPEIL